MLLLLPLFGHCLRFLLIVGCFVLFFCSVFDQILLFFQNEVELIFATEFGVYDPLAMIPGCIDLIARLRNGRFVVLDFKFTDNTMRSFLEKCAKPVKNDYYFFVRLCI